MGFRLRVDNNDRKPHEKIHLQHASNMSQVTSALAPMLNYALSNRLMLPQEAMECFNLSNLHIRNLNVIAGIVNIILCTCRSGIVKYYEIILLN